MIAKLSLLFVAGTLVLAMTPVAAAAQESSLDAPRPELPAPGRSIEDVNAEPDSGPVVAALRLSTEYAALLAPPATDLSAGEALGQADEQAPTAPAAAKGSGTGLGFMIGGAAAFVGGLIIGGTGGTIIAAGGVALGVYGAIIYF